MKVVNVDSIDYHLIDGGYYADKDDIDELDSIEMYTKDEVIAMFTELLLEIEQCGVEDSHLIIKDKINKLKENKE